MGYHTVNRKVELHPPFLQALSYPLGSLEHLLFHEGVSHLVTHRLYECVSHSTTDEDLVYIGLKVLKDTDLSRDLGPAEDCDKGPHRVVHHPLEILYLLLEEKPCSRGKELWYSHNGSMVPVCCSKGIIYIKISQISKVPGKDLVILLLSFMESEVLQYHHITRLHLFDQISHLGTDTVRGEDDFLVQKPSQPFGHRGEAVPGVGLSLGPAEMGGK